MMEQPEALRLADELENFWGYYDGPEEPNELNAAAELRRLHKQNDQLSEGIIAATNTINRLHAQRNELLTALNRIVSWSEHMPEFAVDYGSNGVRDFYRKIAYAAIIKAEGK